ncbi:MAG: hypothetical protein ABI689_06815 [Thermoanaerobaculia bacterium]
MSRTVVTGLTAALLSVLVLVVFLSTVSHGWAPIDDGLNFTRNEHYRGLGWENLRWMWTTRLAGHYIPLSWMSLGADYLVSDMNPAGYHRTNVLLHLANALLFFALSLRLLRADGAGSATQTNNDPATVLAAFAAAAFFAAHPLRVESVAWITERRDLLCGFFVLITVHAYLVFVASVSSRRRRALFWALAAFAAALLAKGIAIILPLALLALDAGPLRRLDADPRRWRFGEMRGILVEKLPFVLLSATFAILTLWAIAPVMAASKIAGLEHRLLAAGYGLSFYLEKTFLPFAIPFQVPTTDLLSTATDPLVALRGTAFVVLLSLTVHLWWRYRRPQPALALLVFTAFVLPVSGLFQAGPQLAAHRYTYLSCLPLALLVGGVVMRAWRSRWPAARAGSVIAVCGLTVLLAQSARAKVELWRDDVSFCRAAVRDAPRAWAPVGALARAHIVRGEEPEALAVLREGRRRFPEALALPYLEALLLASSSNDEVRDGEAAFHLAQEVARRTSFQDPAALLALAAATADSGDGASAKRLLESALELSRAGRKPDLVPALEEAVRQLARSGLVRLTPRDWERLVL